MTQKLQHVQQKNAFQFVLLQNSFVYNENKISKLTFVFSNLINAQILND